MKWLLGVLCILFMTIGCSDGAEELESLESRQIHPENTYVAVEGDTIATWMGEPERAIEEEEILAIGGREIQVSGSGPDGSNFFLVILQLLQTMQSQLWQDGYLLDVNVTMGLNTEDEEILKVVIRRRKQ